jgi:hypothetical protein
MLSVVRRLLRFAAQTCTIVSVLLFAMTTLLWMRSFFYSESIHLYGRWRELDVTSNRGTLDCYRVWFSRESGPTEVHFYRASGPIELEQRRKLLRSEPTMKVIGPIFGFWAFYEPNPRYARFFLELMVPWWFLALLTAVLPVWRVKSWLKSRRRAEPGGCRVCGYDLRASVDRCPECGTPKAVLAERLSHD